jgi:SPP1 gp7 family putative phage head morphogenesis protein
MPTTASRGERRHRAAVVRSARMGGSLARLVQAALASCLDAIPANPGPHDMVRLRSHVEAAVRVLGASAAAKLKRLLIDSAGIEYRRSVAELERAAKRVPVREDWTTYVRLLIPSPVYSVLEAIVGPAYRALTRLIDPQKASNVVLQGIAGGKDRKAIAKDLTDVFGGFENVARRVARDEGVRVATASQLAVSEQIPSLVIGYQIHSVLDERVRPEHRRRDGRKFFREPTGDQRPLSECPHPPIEADGKWAYGCRCFLTPIIRGDSDE